MLYTYKIIKNVSIKKIWELVIKRKIQIQKENKV